MVGNEGLKKSLDKSKKEVYKDNKCREDLLESFTLREIPSSIITKKEIKGAIRFLDKAKRRLKKILDRA